MLGQGSGLAPWACCLDWALRVLHEHAVHAGELLVAISGAGVVSGCCGNQAMGSSESAWLLCWRCRQAKPSCACRGASCGHSSSNWRASVCAGRAMAPPRNAWPPHRPPLHHGHQSHPHPCCPSSFGVLQRSFLRYLLGAGHELLHRRPHKMRRMLSCHGLAHVMTDSSPFLMTMLVIGVIRRAKLLSIVACRSP